MSKGDNTKTRTTRELDAAKLAALAKESVGAADPIGVPKRAPEPVVQAKGTTRIPRTNTPARVLGSPTPPARVHAAPTVPAPSRTSTPRSASPTRPPSHDLPVAVGRTATLDDPLTTGLLAEVARQSQTQEFDDDVIKEVLGSLEKPENRHPHTKKRSG